MALDSQRRPEQLLNPKPWVRWEWEESVKAIRGRAEGQESGSHSPFGTS